MIIRIVFLASLVTAIALFARWNRVSEQEPLAEITVASLLNTTGGVVEVPGWRPRAYPRPFGPRQSEFLMVTERKQLAPRSFTAGSYSHFSIDTDTAAYSRLRDNLIKGEMPDPESIRIEEIVNYFRYDYPAPGENPFAVTTELTTNPWALSRDQSHSALLSIGIQAKVEAALSRAPVNLIFVIDVSGSMRAAERLPLLRQALVTMVDAMRSDDRIAVVAYAGSAHVVLPPTAGFSRHAIKSAIESLDSGGGTSCENGLEIGYALASESYLPTHRSTVILATDGEIPGQQQGLEQLIRDGRAAGTTLSILGVGTVGMPADRLLNNLARQGDGSYHHLADLAEAERVLVQQVDGLLTTVARDVKVEVEFNHALVASWRLLGYDDRRITSTQFADDRVDAGDLGAGQQATALYEIIWTASGATHSNAPVATIAMRYKDPDTNAPRLLFTDVRRDQWVAPERISDDLRLAISAAGLGRVLRGEPVGPWDINSEGRRLLAEPTVRNEPLQQELADLLALAKQMTGATASLRTSVSIADSLDEPGPLDQTMAWGAVDSVQTVLAGSTRP